MIAVAHDIRSMHNVGAIFRTADGAGFDRVILSGCSGRPPDPRIAKVALGADEALAWSAAADVSDLIDQLEGACVVLLEQHVRSVPPANIVLPDEREIALVVCDEIHGSPPELIARADVILELPMRGSKESLNVSVAFGIAAYRCAELSADGEQAATAGLRSREAPRPVRPGVLTYGRTRGQRRGAPRA